MSSVNASGDLSSEMKVDAFRSLFPLRFHERHLLESIRLDDRKLGKARDTTLALGAVASPDTFSVLYLLSWTLKSFVFVQTMLAAIKMEVMTPTTESPNEGCIVIDFHMPPICSLIVWPDRLADAAPVISKPLSDTILSSGMINFRELSLVSGKAAWMAYLDICCLDADGALFDATLLAAVVAVSHSILASTRSFTYPTDARPFDLNVHIVMFDEAPLIPKVYLPLNFYLAAQIPVVSLNDDGKVVVISEEDGGKLKYEPVNKGKRKLKLNSVPFSLTCILHKNYILANPIVEEESIMETLVTVVLDSSFQLVSLYKSGGPVLAYTSAI
ncbi:hypothetical protein ACSBR2_034097 [Camellia fascicularis]